MGAWLEMRGFLEALWSLDVMSIDRLLAWVGGEQFGMIFRYTLI